MIYPVAIQKDPNNNTPFVAIVPDLPNLHIEGDSMADVIHNARLVIMAHLQSKAENNEPIASGQDISVHLDNPKFFGHTWAIISLDSLRFTQSTLTYHLTLPKTTLDAICRTLGDNASPELVQAFMLDAIKHKLTTMD